MSDKKTNLPAIRLLVDSQYGVYVPQRFIKSYNMELWTGISEENKTILLDGVDHPYYWDAWDEVLSNARFIQGGPTWTLYQDGDLWAMCVELMTDEEKLNWGFWDFQPE